MVGQHSGRKKKVTQTAYKEVGQNGGKAEREISAERLSDYVVQTGTEFEAEGNDD